MPVPMAAHVSGFVSNALSTEANECVYFVVQIDFLETSKLVPDPVYSYNKNKISGLRHWLLLFMRYGATRHPLHIRNPPADQRSSLVGWAGLMNGPRSRIAAYVTTSGRNLCAGTVLCELSRNHAQRYEPTARHQHFDFLL